MEKRTRKYVKEFLFSSFARNLSGRYGEKLLDTATNTGQNAAETASKIVVHKTSSATGKLVRNKIAKRNSETKACT